MIKAEKKGLRILSAVGVVAMGVVGSGGVLAEGTPGSPNDVLQRPPELKAPEASPLPGGSAAAAAAALSAPNAAGARTLTVQSFHFAGNTLFDSATLEGLVASYRNRPITLAQLYQAADVVGQYYVSQGYPLASAVIPAQNVTDGVVNIEVLEGRVSKVRFEGLKRYKKADLLTYLPEIEGQIYRGKAFERGLRNIDELPGLDGKAVLKPGAAYGTTEIVIEAKEKPIEGEVFFDNSGRETVGERRMAAQVAINNPGGLGDVITLLGLRSTNDRLQYLYGSYGLPLGVSGARINVSYGYARFNLSDSVEGLTGSNRTARGELTVPLVRDAANRLVASLALTDTDADTDLSGIGLSKTQITLFEVGGNYAHTWDSQAVTQFSTVISSNFDEASPDNRNGQRFRSESDLQHFQPLPYGFQLFGHGIFVYSPDPLPDTQQFAIGGPASVRGYAPSEVRGDWGYFGSLTLRRPMPVYRAVIAPRVFVDAGRVRSRQFDGGLPEVSLSSVGVGFDLNYQNLVGKLDYAIPLDGRTVSDGRDDGRFYGSIAFNF